MRVSGGGEGGGVLSRFGSGGAVTADQCREGGSGWSCDRQCEHVEFLYSCERHVLAFGMPPKNTTSAAVWAELEEFVKDNAQMLADRHRLPSCSGPVGSTAHLLRNVFRTKPPLEHKFYKFLERILEKPDTLKPEQSARLDGIWQVVARATTTAMCHDDA